MTGGGGADSGQLDVILHRRFRQGGHQRDQSGERIGDADSRRKSSGEEASCQDGGSGHAHHGRVTNSRVHTTQMVHVLLLQ